MGFGDVRSRRQQPSLSNICQPTPLPEGASLDKVMVAWTWPTKVEEMQSIPHARPYSLQSQTISTRNEFKSSCYTINLLCSSPARLLSRAAVRREGEKKGTRQCYVFFSNSYPTILSFCSFFLDSSPCPPIQAYLRKVGMYVVCKSKSIHGTAHPWSLPQPARRDLAQTTTLSTLVHIPILFRTLAMLGSSRGRLDMI